MLYQIITFLQDRNIILIWNRTHLLLISKLNVQSIPFRECVVPDTCLYMFALTSKPILRPWVNVSIRDCIGSPNNRALTFHKVSATHMTAQPLCDRLVLVREQYGSVHFFTMPSAPTPLHLIIQLFLDFLTFFRKVASTKIRFTSGTCGNLTVLQYTLRIQYLSVMCHPPVSESCRFSIFKWKQFPEPPS